MNDIYSIYHYTSIQTIDNIKILRNILRIHASRWPINRPSWKIVRYAVTRIRESGSEKRHIIAYINRCLIRILTTNPFHVSIPNGDWSGEGCVAPRIPLGLRQDACDMDCIRRIYNSLLPANDEKHLCFIPRVCMYTCPKIPEHLFARIGYPRVAVCYTIQPAKIASDTSSVERLKTNKSVNKRWVLSDPNIFQRVWIRDITMIRTCKLHGITHYHQDHGIFFIHDNGGRPFTVTIDRDRIRVYRRIPDDVEQLKLIMDIREFVGYWIGNHIEHFNPQSQWRWFDIHDENASAGNSILILIRQQYKHRRIRYLWLSIGWFISSFWTDDIIHTYTSFISNSDVPYPIAYGNENVYFMCEWKKYPMYTIPQLQIPRFVPNDEDIMDPYSIYLYNVMYENRQNHPPMSMAHTIIHYRD